MDSVRDEEKNEEKREKERERRERERESEESAEGGIFSLSVWNVPTLPKLRVRFGARHSFVLLLPISNRVHPFPQLIFHSSTPLHLIPILVSKRQLKVCLLYTSRCV